MKNKAITIIYICLVSVLILTVCISVPIYFRPFYYAQIKPLKLEFLTGFSYEQIKNAYDSVLTYLTVPFTEFSVGDLAYSESGKAHFVDCKFLFMLNFWGLTVSLASVIAIKILNKKGVVKLVDFYGYKPYFYSAILALLIPLILGSIAVIDFNVAFTLFHAILFPGKSNWIFSSSKDPIILILPEEFFMSCGILIAVLILAICGCLITLSIIKKRKAKSIKT